MCTSAHVLADDNCSVKFCSKSRKGPKSLGFKIHKLIQSNIYLKIFQFLKMSCPKVVHHLPTQEIILLFPKSLWVPGISKTNMLNHTTFLTIRTNTSHLWQRNIIFLATFKGVYDRLFPGGNYLHFFSHEYQLKSPENEHGTSNYLKHIPIEKENHLNQTCKF